MWLNGVQIQTSAINYENSQKSAALWCAAKFSVTVKCDAKINTWQFPA